MRNLLRTIRVILLILVAVAAFISVMEFFPNHRMWVALGLFLLVDGAIIFGAIRSIHDPEVNPPPTCYHILVLGFSIPFYLIFISWLTQPE